MKKLFLFVLSSLFSLTSFAWNHSIELGYGHSHDPNHTKYNNSGVLLSSDLFPLWSNPWTFLSINGAIGRWYATTPHHKYLTTAAVVLALRFYPCTSEKIYPPYLLLSAGPAALSNRTFGLNKQGSNLTFQLYGGVGIEFHQLDVNLRMTHYSNAHLANPDHGFTTLYMLSLGYLFW